MYLSFVDILQATFIRMKIYYTLILIFFVAVELNAQHEIPVLEEEHNGFYIRTINDEDPSGINPDDKRLIHYSNTALIEFKDIQKIMVSKPKGFPWWIIFFRLNDHATKGLTHFTTHYKGIPIKRRGGAVYDRKIVLVIQNKVVSVANVNSVIKNGTFSLGQFDNKKQAKEIIKRIKQAAQ
jgi:preprotein translocase subunit SecD